MLPKALILICLPMTPRVSKDGRPVASEEVRRTINGDRADRWKVSEQVGNVVVTHFRRPWKSMDLTND
jgi:hypothetical protein